MHAQADEPMPVLLQKFHMWDRISSLKLSRIEAGRGILAHQREGGAP
jgi:hypothetical protein